MGKRELLVTDEGEIPRSVKNTAMKKKDRKGQRFSPNVSKAIRVCLMRVP